MVRVTLCRACHERSEVIVEQQPWTSFKFPREGAGGIGWGGVAESRLLQRKREAGLVISSPPARSGKRAESCDPGNLFDKSHAASPRYMDLHSGK